MNYHPLLANDQQPTPAAPDAFTYDTSHNAILSIFQSYSDVLSEARSRVYIKCPQHPSAIRARREQEKQESRALRLKDRVGRPRQPRHHSFEDQPCPPSDERTELTSLHSNTKPLPQGSPPPPTVKTTPTPYSQRDHLGRKRSRAARPDPTPAPPSSSSPISHRGTSTAPSAPSAHHPQYTPQAPCMPSSPVRDSHPYSSSPRQDTRQPTSAPRNARRDSIPPQQPTIPAPRRPPLALQNQSTRPSTSWQRPASPLAHRHPQTAPYQSNILQPIRGSNLPASVYPVRGLAELVRQRRNPTEVVKRDQNFRHK